MKHGGKPIVASLKLPMDSKPERAELYRVLRLVPAMVAISHGPDHTFEFANSLYLKVVGKTSSIIGKTVLQVFPELKGQGIIEILDTVYKTGKEFTANELQILLDINNDGNSETVYFNFVYQPMWDSNGQVAGIMTHAVEVSDQVKAREKAEENETRYRTLFNSIDEGFCLIEMIYNTDNKAIDYKFIETNEMFEKQTGLKDAGGKTVRQLIPEIETFWIERYETVAETGKSIRFTEGSTALGRTYDVHASRVGDVSSRRVAVLFNDITKRKKAEVALKHSEERFRTLIEKSTEAIQLVSPEGKILYTSESIKNVLGYTAEELEGDGVAPYMHPDDAEYFNDKLIELLKNPTKTVTLQYRVKHKDGSWAWLETTGVNHLSTPHIKALVGTFRNITERKKIEEETQYQKSLLEAQQEVSPLGILVVSETGNIVSYNKQFANMWLFPKQVLTTELDEAALKAAQEQLADPEGFIKRVRYLYKKQSSGNDQLHFKDGRIFHRSGAPIFGKNKSYLGYIWYFLDVTEEKRASRNLEASEERLRFMAESMPQKVFTATADGRFDYYNPQWTEWTGINFSELKGSNWTKIIHDKDIDSSISAWKISMQTGEPFEAEHRLRGKDGKYHWHITRAHAMHDNDGKIIKWIGSSTDIDIIKRTLSRKKRLEELNLVLKEQRTQLIEINAAKDEFISLASHQLRTPATGVKQYLGMVLDGFAGNVEADQEKLLQKAYTNNERQIMIINDLLKVAQVDAGKVHLKKQPTELGYMVKDIVADQSGKFKERNQKVEVTTPENITAVVDPNRMRMVLENLIDNASKYTPHGKKIALRVSKVNKLVTIAIQDQGVGIAKADMDKLFRKFTRLENPLSVTIGGTGLGLYWAKKIIDLHDGSIAVDSIPGKTTTFTVYLPET